MRGSVTLLNRVWGMQPRIYKIQNRKLWNNFNPGRASFRGSEWDVTAAANGRSGWASSA